MRTTIAGLLSVMLLMTAAPASAWQGRMESMQTPYGFVADESDFLVHPSLMADFEALTAFTHFAFTYESTPLHSLSLGQAFIFPDYEVTGQDYDILTQSGAVIPLGAGNLGLAFSWKHDWGNTDGEAFALIYTLPINDMETNRLDDDLVFSLLYALPVSDEVNTGVRVDISYISRQQELSFTSSFTGHAENYPLTIPLALIPLSQRYGQADFTLSVDGDFAPYAFAASLHGGFIFAGNENPTSSFSLTTGEISRNNNVNGWNIGGDVWFAYEATEDITVPLTFSVNYENFSSIASGTSWGSLGLSAGYMDYDLESREFSIQGGIGIDYQVTDATRLGGGFTYTYSSLYRHTELTANFLVDDELMDRFTQAHTFAFNVNGEMDVADNVALLCGLDFFISSLVTSDAEESADVNIISERNMAGYNMGLQGSLGLRAEFDDLVLEPFVGAGFSTTRTWGQQDAGPFGAPNLVQHDADFSLDTWFITSGITLAFDGF